MRRAVLFALILIVLIGGCLGGDGGTPTSSPEPQFTPPMTKYDVLEEGQEKPVVKALNAFAFDLYRELAKDDDNVFFSPYSIEVALAMAYEGARGETAEGMGSVLHLPLDEDTRWTGFRYLVLSLKSPEGSPFILRSANALWVQEGYPLREKYLWVVREFYLGEVRKVNFQGDPEGAAKEINEWVENQTNGRIRDIVGRLTPDTRLILTNAIYFKANWSSRFEAINTRNETFYAPNETVIVPMMHQTGRFPYFENDDIQALELPYEGERLSMLIILPRKGKFELVEDSLKAGLIESALKSMKPESVEVIIPKFQFEKTYRLRDVLMDMGMERAFTNADFSGISDGPLAISQVVHKSFISVAENGTEAAAATAVTMTLSAPVEKEEPKIFRADHPFIFVIYDRTTGAMLFMGRLMNPKG
ncbi:serpin family protein [Palaeococcus ferrophilus]|uniref:serpin family protein n=1 Tax=Palaeococcus ferrophilus TaxID=83868 RepID=UPI00064F585D|nr:serpin family protein [Palaeococcus ferrophilus]